MGMNPNTNKFEKLNQIDEKEMAKKLGGFKEQMENYHSGLLRPDGSPVPKTWSVFKMGELVVIKDYTFRVVYIGESNILFEPVSPDEPISI